MSGYGLEVPCCYSLQRSLSQRKKGGSTKEENVCSIPFHTLRSRGILSPYEKSGSGWQILIFPFPLSPVQSLSWGCDCGGTFPLLHSPSSYHSLIRLLVVAAPSLVPFSPWQPRTLSLATPAVVAGVLCPLHPLPSTASDVCLCVCVCVLCRADFLSWLASRPAWMLLK